ncbi:hypothetical protein AMAG_01891 [Allomyces macrogynus ATCC 38327]|uniref:Uncharacterized protein n=1 Tax=Allomyces macrogynus (strain ATCC 38327) TaxID=578462 RepID=A0A0L0S0I1_ALLM3|nr:hypothetical protein AMAG_01891 [Allomyces macrogynus ATCC 38327]|eukprot:KNE56048.1 hypothetical protein AMAG_01891 [Allomyces macrogynus ATCC 38327]
MTSINGALSPKVPPAAAPPSSADLFCYELIRVNTISLGRVHFATGNDGLVTLKAFLITLPTAIIAMILAVLAFSTAAGFASAADASAQALGPMLRNYRTVICFLMALWFFAYHVLSLLVRRNVERYGANETIQGEFCWQNLKRCLGEWDAALVQMPDAAMIAAMRGPRHAASPSRTRVPSGGAASAMPVVLEKGLNGTYGAPPPNPPLPATDVPRTSVSMTAFPSSSSVDALHKVASGTRSRTTSAWSLARSRSCTLDRGLGKSVTETMAPMRGGQTRSRVPTMSSLMSEEELQSHFGATLMVAVRDWTDPSVANERSRLESCEDLRLSPV